MDFLEFYNINEDPFKLTPDPFYFYPSRDHKEILSSLNYVIEHKEGFFMVTGLPGTGKTTVTKVFIDSWKDKAIIALILTPRLSPEEFLLAILEDLSVDTGNKNKNDIIRTFRDFLIENATLGKRVIIIVDEAQNLPAETLEELRLLSNLETDKEKLLQIVLIGQPELQKRLESDNLKQLNQRITVRTQVRPLTADETTEYINYRLIKGGKGFASFDKGANRLVYEFSTGIPRLVNQICSRAMMAAYLNGNTAVSRKHVRQAVRHLSDVISKPSRTARRIGIAAVLFISLSLALILTVKYRSGMEDGRVLQPAKAQDDAAPHAAPPSAAALPEQKEVKAVEQGNQEANRTEQVQDAEPVNGAQEAPPPKSPQETDMAEGNGKRTATVVAGLVNVMAAPGPGAKAVTWVVRDEVYEITDETRDSLGVKWYKIRLSEGREGWITKDSIKIKNPS